MSALTANYWPLQSWRECRSTDDGSRATTDELDAPIWSLFSYCGARHARNLNISSGSTDGSSRLGCGARQPTCT